MTDTLMTIGAAATAIAAIIGVSIFLFRGIRALARGLKRLSLFFEDWFGEAPRPGVPGHKGVMARLADTEYKAGRAEWHAGNGSEVPMRSVIDATSERLIEMEDRLGLVEGTVTREHGPLTGEIRTTQD